MNEIKTFVSIPPSPSPSPTSRPAQGAPTLSTPLSRGRVVLLEYISKLKYKGKYYTEVLLVIYINGECQFYPINSQKLTSSLNAPCAKIVSPSPLPKRDNKKKAKNKEKDKIQDNHTVYDIPLDPYDQLYLTTLPFLYTTKAKTTPLTNNPLNYLSNHNNESERVYRAPRKIRISENKELLLLLGILFKGQSCLVVYQIMDIPGEENSEFIPIYYDLSLSILDVDFTPDSQSLLLISSFSPNLILMIKLPIFKLNSLNESTSLEVGLKGSNHISKEQTINFETRVIGPICMFGPVYHPLSSQPLSFSRIESSTSQLVSSSPSSINYFNFVTWNESDRGEYCVWRVSNDEGKLNYHYFPNILLPIPFDDHLRSAPSDSQGGEEVAMNRIIDMRLRECQLAIFTLRQLPTSQLLPSSSSPPSLSQLSNNNTSTPKNGINSGFGGYGLLILDISSYLLHHISQSATNNNDHDNLNINNKSSSSSNNNSNSNNNNIDSRSSNNSSNNSFINNHHGGNMYWYKVADDSLEKCEIMSFKWTDTFGGIGSQPSISLLLKERGLFERVGRTSSGFYLDYEHFVLTATNFVQTNKFFRFWSSCDGFLHAFITSPQVSPSHPDWNELFDFNSKSPPVPNADLLKYRIIARKFGYFINAISESQDVIDAVNAINLIRQNEATPKTKTKQNRNGGTNNSSSNSSSNNNSSNNPNSTALVEDKSGSGEVLRMIGAHLYKCWNCKTVLLKPLQCSRCKCVVYCNQFCQKEHWLIHRQVCTEQGVFFPHKIT